MSTSGTGNAWVACKDDIAVALEAAKSVTDESAVGKHNEARKIMLPALRKLPLATHFAEAWKSRVAMLNDADGGPFEGAPTTANFKVKTSWIAGGTSSAEITSRKQTTANLVLFLQELQKYVEACIVLDGGLSALGTSDPGVPPTASQTDLNAQSFRAGWHRPEAAKLVKALTDDITPYFDVLISLPWHPFPDTAAALQVQWHH